MLRTFAVYVENKPGVLNRVASLARRLAINIDSLTVGPTENEEIARMTICAHTDEKGAHRLESSLEKLVDVDGEGELEGFFHLRQIGHKDAMADGHRYLGIRH